MGATPVSQAGSATVAGVSTMANGNRSALAVPENSLSASFLADLSAGAKSISDAKDLIQSRSPSDWLRVSPFSNIVIRFKQDMDASTLVYPNIIILEDQHSTVVALHVQLQL